MINFVCYIVIIALLAAFFVQLGKKWRVVEWVQVHGNKFFSEMFHCDFCLSFWACAVLSAVAFVFTGDALLLAVPFCATMLARILL